MNISLFGPIRITVSGRTFDAGDFGGVKPKELLELLLLARGHPVRKDTLIDTLWPTSPPKNPSGTLESYISVLRKRLFSDSALARRTIVTTWGAYRFSLDEAAIDLEVFDRLLERADRSPATRLPLLQQAAELSVGALLEDVGDSEWIEHDRELYRERVARIHLIIGSDLLVAREPVAALRHAETVLKIRPYCEEAFQIIMLAYHALGHSDMSRGVFVRCRRMFADDLGHDCTTVTEDLGSAIDAGVPASTLIATRWPAVPTGPAIPSQRRADRRDPTRQLPFIGHRDELSSVRAHCEVATNGQFRVVLVRGRPGIGRSTFLAQLQHSLTGSTGRVAFRPLDFESPQLPLAAAVVAALRGHRGADDARRYQDASSVYSCDDTLEQLHEVIATHGPMVLLLDDLQWADADTISALVWLGRRYPELPLAVIATVREPGLGIHDSLLGVTSEVVTLPGINAVHAAEFHGVDAGLIRATGGIPAILADSWRWFQGGGTGPSPSLRENLLRTVRGLGGPHAAVLCAAAVLPEPFGAADLRQSLARTEPEIAVSIERLVQLDILERRPRGVGFRASIVRDVLAATPTPARLADRDVKSA